MRILRLELLAFGPFTDRSLEFSQETGLHLVHGPNEAGKSSALRALRNWLYGIPQRSTDNFVHPHPNLRIGGMLEAADGTRLEFIRRKALKKDLRCRDDDAVFDESKLLSLLGGTDEQTFAQRFGIDYEELRRGGKAVVEGRGDLSEILFAAGAGVADLRKIQQQLEQEADALFKARGSTQRIGQSLSELDKLRKGIRDTQLPTSHWVEHDRALRTAEKRQRELDKELTGKRTELNRLDRIRESLPLIGKLKPLRVVLAAVGDAPLLPETFTADRREAELKLSNAQGDEAKAQQEIERLQADIRAVIVPAELVEHQTAITTLHTELGAYKKAAHDRPDLVAKRDSAQRDAMNRMNDLNKPIALAEVDSLRLSRTLRRKIQDLAGECKALVESQRTSQEDFQKLGERIERIQAEVNRLPPERNVSDLDREIRLVQKSGNLDAQRLKANTELESLNQKVQIALERLTLFQGTLDQLEKLPIPSVETIDRFEKRLADADDKVRRCQEKIEKLNGERLTLQGKLDALRLEREVPTEAELAAIRKQRDAGWELILKVGLPANAAQGRGAPEPAIAEFVAAFAPGGDLPTAFQASIGQADDIADRLRREADRVAQQAQLTADVQQIDSDLDLSTEAVQEAELRREQLGQDWQSLWQPVGIEPLPPREMRAWRTPQQALVELAADIRQRQADLQGIQSQIDAHRSELNNCLTALELPSTLPPLRRGGRGGGGGAHSGVAGAGGGVAGGSDGSGPDSPLASLLDFCEETAAAIRKQNQERERQASELAGLREDLPEAKRKAVAAHEKLQEWRTAWAEAVAPIGLNGEAQPTEANVVIGTIDELLKTVDELRDKEERIAGIDSDAAKYQQSVRQLLDQVAPDLIDAWNESVERAVADLVDRLNRAVTDQTKIQSWQEQLQKQPTARDTAATRIKQAEQQLEQLCQQAGCQSPAELPHAEARASQRRKAEAEIQNLEQRLCELAAGAALAAWIEQAEAIDSDRVSVDLAALHEAIAALEAEKQTVSESLGAHRNELNRMDGSGKAAEAQIEAEHLLASIRSDAEQYIRHKLASAVLARAMERFRQSSQGPVLSRASDLFSMLTINSFTGLRADYDDKGTAILVGVRADGQTVPVSGMSEGTCDQIYLALRIAMIESTLTGREPLPFIVDDILAMYDDDRAGAALRVLLQLSQKTQVILFTHHSHLIEIARKLPDNGLLSVIGL